MSRYLEGRHGMGKKERRTCRAHVFLFRAVLIALALAPLLFIDDIRAHVTAHFTGAIRGVMITGQWHVVALNVGIFLAFLLPLSFRQKAHWGERGIVVAFFVSLFIEMYGIPLSLLIASRFVPLPSTNNDPHLHIAVSYDLFGVDFDLTMTMIYGTVLMVFGTALIIIGWVALYRGVKGRDEGTLVTDGIYSVTRNPQYLGFIIVVLGWLVGWPTPLTVVLALILIIMYIRLCKIEEGELERAGVRGLKRYIRDVPLLV